MRVPTGRKRGGQPGNHNHLKHGFYAEHFTPEELVTLHKTPEDLQHQIDLLFLFANRIAIDLSSVETYTETDLKKLNTLTAICLAIGTLKRDKAFLYGNISGVDKAIEEALMGEKKGMVTGMSTLKDQAKALIKHIDTFAANGGGVRLYGYQLAPAEAILDSVKHNLGLTFVVVMPRQAGKDEMLCHLKAYLMRMMSNKERGIVEVNPTYKPQTIQAIMRLENRMNANIACTKHLRKRSDFIRYIEHCRTSFLSGDGAANVVGASADLLLIVNEAQDISPAIYDKKFSPMTAARNATRVVCGTVWTSHTLLARELRAARIAEKEDGRQRVFFVTAEEVGNENKRYAQFLEGEINKLGRNHPFVKTQYFCEEIDAEAGMFNPTRRALMQGDQPWQNQPTPGTAYGFLLDVAGQDEARMNVNDDDVQLSNSGRDAASLSIVSVDLSTLATLQAPTFRVVHRQQWTGLNHLVVFGRIKALADAWQPQHFVVDATGVGEGMWAMLDKAYPTRVIPVKFSQVTKSEIGWRFLAIIETGRFRDCCPTNAVRLQYDSCTSEILPGPAHTMRWSVPEGMHGPDGELIHDDYLMADALVVELDKLTWSVSTNISVIESGFNPLERGGKF